MKIQSLFSFKADSLEGSTFLSLFEQYIRFKPFYFVYNNATKAWDREKHMRRIATALAKDSISVYSASYDSFATGITGTEKPHQYLSITQDRELYFPSDEDIEVIVDFQGFTAAYLFDNEYKDVQSQPFQTNYAERKYSQRILNSVANTPYKIDRIEEKEYDISYNPGRLTLIGHTWIMAAWKMWFGAPFFELVPKEKILNFPNAYKIIELEDDKVFVQLYENIEDTTSQENMLKQQEWRNWLKFDELEKKYP